MLRFWRRRQLRRQPLSPPWWQILETTVPLCRQLPQPMREALEQHVQIFLDEKHFEGCGGLEVTDEMRLTIAGYGCLLLLGNPDGYYPRLGTVVIYPESFAAPIRDTDRFGIVTETIEERLGESWEEGTVVLAWDSIEELIHGTSGDLNVVVHEFAHQLDAQRKLTGGAGLLALRGRYRNWQELLEAERRGQRSARRRGRPTVLDPYAFTSPEELFAVATETFFMRPVRFQAGHPELYAELQAIYGLDPASWPLAADDHAGVP